jgi:hypothetical protein
MEYRGSSYHVIYENNTFDSALELTWFLFLSELEITKNNLTVHPLDYKFQLSWYPDFRFILFNPSYTEVFAEVKPLAKSEFEKELNLLKYKRSDSETCILGYTNTDYEFLSNKIEISKVFDEHLRLNSDKWQLCSNKANEFARTYGSAKGFNEPRLSFGKYKGYSLKEIKQKDPNYYKWYMDTYD